MKAFRRLPFVAAAAAMVAVAGLAVAMPADASSARTFKTWVNSSNGLCMGVSGGNMNNGTPVISWTCNGNADQYWEYQGGPGPGFYPFRNLANQNKCLSLLRNQWDGTLNTGDLVISDCDGSAEQTWQWTLTASGASQVHNGIGGNPLWGGSAEGDPCGIDIHDGEDNDAIFTWRTDPPPATGPGTEARSGRGHF